MENLEKFKILTLSGGGARGVFQAEYLKLVEEKLNCVGKLHEHFQLIAGTSTGSITAAAIAQGIPASAVCETFQSLAPAIFKPRGSWCKCLSYFFGGPRFSLAALEKKLNELLKGTFKDYPKLLVTASQIQPYGHKLFSSGLSSDVNVCDGVLGSCSAPSYFKSHRIDRLKASFIDGGLWANDPALVAYTQASRTTDVSNIRILSIGTGEFEQGINPKDYDSRSTVDQAIRVIDLMFATQEKSCELYLQSLHERNQIYRVNTRLTSPIALSDATSALETLPGLARKAFDDHFDTAIGSFFQD